MEKLIFTPKSIIGLCLCVPPMRVKHTISASPPIFMNGIMISPCSEEKTAYYGPEESNCKYCGKPWSEHHNVKK